MKSPNIGIIGIPEEEDKKKDHEKILEEIIVENFPKMRKKNGDGGKSLLVFRQYYIANVIKTVWNWHKNNLWDNVKCPNI